MSKPLVLTVDIGTQSMRVMLVSPDGDIIDKVQKKYETPYFSPCPGWAEQEPNFYYDVLCEIGRQLRARNEERFGDIIAVSLTSIRDTLMCLDKNGEPLRNTIVWLDNREATKAQPFSPVAAATLKLTGFYNTCLSYYRASQCNWIIENQPEIWQKTAKFVMLPAYMHFKLTGVLKDAVANCCGHIPFDSKNRRWMKKSDIRRLIFDIPDDKLCDIVEAGETIGYITKQASGQTGVPEGLPLIATGPDKGCETLGLSVVRKNQAALAFGTIATLQFASDKYFEPAPNYPAMPGVLNHLYNSEISIYRGFWMISWFKKEFAQHECAEAKKLGCAPEELLNRQLQSIPAGCDGLLLQPYWRPSSTAPDGKGAIIGFSDVHTRIHIYRAIIEGIGFALMDGLYAMEKRSGHKIEELFVGGGGSQSDEICQITANMFGLPVKRIQTHEATGLGAAMVPFVATGVFDDYNAAIGSMVHVKDEFVPVPEQTAVYARLYQIYKEIYHRLSPLYVKIKQIVGERYLPYIGTEAGRLGAIQQDNGTAFDTTRYM